jgi:hypothetical protein
MPPTPWSVADPEAAMARLVLQHTGSSLWFLRHPWVLLRVAALALRLPLLRLRPSSSVEAQLSARRLQRSRFARATVIQEIRSVLALPTDGTPYDQGRARATQRRKPRAAVKHGVTTRLVTDPAERRALFARSMAYLREHPDATYRITTPKNDDLFEVGLWMAAFQDDRPLLLTVIPVDGEFATLRFFRTMESGPAASSARYLVTGVLAEELAGRGVRYLCDTVNPLRQEPGLLHFARMVGFRMARVRVG